MPSDITIVIADASRMPAMRNALTLQGRAMWFPGNKMGSAWESIQLNHPKLVVVDAQIGETPQGQALLERVEKMSVHGTSIRLIVRGNGSWLTEPYKRDAVTAVEIFESRDIVEAAEQTTAPAVTPAKTRRSPRYQVIEPVSLKIESGDASLVDLSVIGAQVLSGPILRPNQTITIALPDPAKPIRLTAQIAWSTMQQTRERPDAHFRAGMEFSDAAGSVLAEYCRRYCGSEAYR